MCEFVSKILKYYLKYKPTALDNILMSTFEQV